MPARPGSRAGARGRSSPPTLAALAAAVVVAIVIPAAVGTLAAQEAPGRPTDGQEVRGPELRRQGDVLYVTGGIGLSEREALEAMARREGLNLKVVVADRDGTYLADVPVRIRTGDGALLLEAVLEGPWLYVRLPPGEYRVEGSFPGGLTEGSARVPAEGRRELVLSGPTSSDPLTEPGVPDTLSDPDSEAPAGPGAPDAPPDTPI